MKKILVSLIILSAAIAGCNKDLDRFPLDRPSNENFYTNEQELLLAVNACYNYLTVRMEGTSRGPLNFSSDFVTDISGSRSTGNPFGVLKRGELSETHSVASLYWDHHYRGINRTSALLENMSKAEAKTSPPLFRQIRSEARVIRAICYMELIQKYGDVPLVTTSIGENEAFNATRTPKAEILQFIYKELDESVADLPKKYNGAANWGRITQGAALAMRARIALYNKDWALARKAAKDVIDLNVYKLYPNYRELFTLKATNSITNEEAILLDQYNQLERTTSYHFHLGPRNSNGQAQSFPTEDLVASFECIDGKPVDESPLYDPTNPFVKRDPRLFGAVMVPRVWDGTSIKTGGTVFNGFEYMTSREILKGANGSLLSSSLSEKEKNVLDQKSNKTVQNQEVTNTFASFTGYNLMKYIDSVFVSIPNAQYTNFILCRYAEVLLTYVEASVELGQVDQSVLDALNTVRARGYGLTNISSTGYPKVTTTDVAELRKIIRRERKVELCFEGFRYEDLKRWGLLEKALNQHVTWGRPENYTKLAKTDIPQIDDDGFVTFPYAEETYGLQNEQKKLRKYETYGIITSKFYLLPIPLGERELNRNLTQNPGY